MEGGGVGKGGRVRQTERRGREEKNHSIGQTECKTCRAHIWPNLAQNGRERGGGDMGGTLGGDEKGGAKSEGYRLEKTEGWNVDKG